MNEPTGLGIWIAFASAVGGHAKAAEQLVELGASWVAPRAGASDTRDAAWSAPDARAHVRRYHDAGLRVYPWLYSRPWSYRLEVALLRRLVEDGADGVIIDAETPWDSGQRTTALKYVDALDAALPGVFIADAPWAYPSYHPGFPFAEFGKRMNARMPQCYWTEFDNRGAAWHLPRIDAQWTAFHDAHRGVARPIMPIGVTYGHEHPSHPPGTFVPAELTIFLDRYASSGCSLYTLEAARADAKQLLRARRTACAFSQP
jgi:hypothetical protein